MVAVLDDDDVPAVSLVALGNILSEGNVGVTINGNVVVVVDGNEVAELEVTSQEQASPETPSIKQPSPRKQ